jgi:LCP family protein required for cell wall assembly
MKKNQRPQPIESRPIQNGLADKGQKGKKKKGKIWLIVLIVVALLAVVGIAGGTYISELLNLIDRTQWTGDPNLDESDLIEPGDTVNEPDSSGGIDQAAKDYEAIKKIKIPSDKDVYNILLIGSDERPGESRGRSDAMIIASINNRTGNIHLTSLMRAMYVAIPGRGWSMLNHSYAWGGADLLLQTIEDNLRIKIDDYMVVNFSGFTKAIDAVGGVTITLTSAEAKYLGLSEGANRMNGATALNYARIRKIDSDFERTGRQRKVIEALIQETRSLNITQMTNLAEALLPLVRTNLSNTQLISLMTKMLSARNYPVDQLMLPLKEHREMIYVRKMEMYRFDFGKTIETLHTFIYGTR